MPCGGITSTSVGRTKCYDFLCEEESQKETEIIEGVAPDTPAPFLEEKGVKTYMNANIRAFIRNNFV